jgi:hypothetical protein
MLDDDIILVVPGVDASTNGGGDGALSFFVVVDAVLSDEAVKNLVVGNVVCDFMTGNDLDRNGIALLLLGGLLDVVTEETARGGDFFPPSSTSVSVSVLLCCPCRFLSSSPLSTFSFEVSAALLGLGLAAPSTTFFETLVMLLSLFFLLSLSTPNRSYISSSETTSSPDDVVIGGGLIEFCNGRFFFLIVFVPFVGVPGDIEDFRRLVGLGLGLELDVGLLLLVLESEPDDEEDEEEEDDDDDEELDDEEEDEDDVDESSLSASAPSSSSSSTAATFFFFFGDKGGFFFFQAAFFLLSSACSNSISSVSFFVISFLRFFLLLLFGLGVPPEDLFFPRYFLFIFDLRLGVDGVLSR